MKTIEQQRQDFKNRKPSALVDHLTMLHEILEDPDDNCCDCDNDLALGIIYGLIECALETDNTEIDALINYEGNK